ncbi:MULTISPECIES: hypothetical protein [unclassified Enterococcus]|uniref:hypothetical protein n=1 Tax=unclassified Enterococcus TaxID=2608891 RepID=UPI001CE185AC|nr:MULTISPECIES: hypothetical protein [unclassified Enterococcus]MCA5014127.1 hypothetical protein [Enterococcus sp. S23]MCA5017653.1 hypothetical protein [Enterococcus sp. S22(2020)]
MSLISIEPAAIEEEISFLKELLQKKRTIISVQSTNKGETATKMNEVLKYSETLDEYLNLMIQNTISFLENAKDAYVDVDAKSAAVLDHLLAEEE